LLKDPLQSPCSQIPRARHAVDLLLEILRQGMLGRVLHVTGPSPWSSSYSSSLSAGFCLLGAFFDGDGFDGELALLRPLLLSPHHATQPCHTEVSDSFDGAAGSKLALLRPLSPRHLTATQPCHAEVSDSPAGQWRWLGSWSEGGHLVQPCHSEVAAGFDSSAGHSWRPGSPPVIEGLQFAALSRSPEDSESAGIGGQQTIVARLFELPYSIAELVHISMQIQAQIQFPSEIQIQLSMPH